MIKAGSTKKTSSRDPNNSILSMEPFSRVLLKLSGEAFSGEGAKGFDGNRVSRVVSWFRELIDTGTEVASVLGAGNLIRGRELQGTQVRSIIADEMGMLATVINALILREALENSGMKAVIMAPRKVSPYVLEFCACDAIHYLERGYVVLLAGGTGNPFFTTDTASALRAAELGCELLMKGTKVKGVYDSDPKQNPQAKIFDVIEYDEVIKRNLGVMDLEALLILKKAGIPAVVFDMEEDGVYQGIVRGEKRGTLISMGGKSN